MAFMLKQMEKSKIHKGRVELHLHLDGSIRLSTIWELANKKGIKIGNRNTVEEVERMCKVHNPSNLSHFLKKWNIFLPTIIGDKEAIERIAYEICEDEALQNVAYFETRFSPQLLSNTAKHHLSRNILSLNDKNAVTPRDVIECVQKGLIRGERDFGVKARSILASICGHSDWSEEVLTLAQEFKNRGVVAIDIAGDENSDESINSFDSTEVQVFKRAKELGIHRTVHAGENGSANNVLFALEEMFAERIGHGYHAIDDLDIYQKCLNTNVHFETCPHSSYLTGSVKCGEKHPIVKFAEDGANFSINKDDTTPIQVDLDEEYDLLRRMGLNESHFVKAGWADPIDIYNIYKLSNPKSSQQLAEIHEWAHSICDFNVS